jgi:cardiolipin synthase
MLGTVTGANWTWFCSGDEIFPAMLEAIEGAQKSVCLETYTFSVGPLGEKFRDALIRAHDRGAEVRVLIDALGSMTLPENFWAQLRGVGARVRVFNPLSLNRLGIRNHRKLLVCDDEVAFVGGFNISSEYEGDGVRCGWCDLGLKIAGPLVTELTASFDAMFSLADFQHKRFMQLRKFSAKKTVQAQNGQLLLSGPGRGRSPIKEALQWDIAHGRQIQIIVAYFLPSWRMRKSLGRVAHRGGNVNLILPGKSDVVVSQLAGRSLYSRLLRGGVRIHEYQPQILHAKLFIIDDVVYVGSANLDQRSLSINYELMIRFESKVMAEQARQVFEIDLKNSLEINADHWRRSNSIWRRLKQHWSYFLLARIDPYIAGRQWRRLPD